MSNFTTNTYQMKRDILNFSKKFFNDTNNAKSKFVNDMIYGISKSKDVLLSSIADALNEHTKKCNTIDRLSTNLTMELDASIDTNYCNMVMDTLGERPVFLIDDSDIVKPSGNKFENLAIVRDGSSKDKSYEKGYIHTEIVGLTQHNKQPISIYSKIYSSNEKEFISANKVTFDGLDKVVNLLNQRNRKGIFISDRGYDSNDMFNYYFSKKQDFVIKLTEKRKIYRNHKWFKITTLRDGLKGKLKFKILFQGEEKECSISVINARIVATKQWIHIIFVYGLASIPMMLATNIDMNSKDDAYKVARLYFDRWRIEEYFKFKKQEYSFENFRVRTLKAMNNLNSMVSYVIGLVAMLSEKIGKREFVNVIIKKSQALKSKVHLWFYQIARGISNILSMTRTGIRELQHIRKTKICDGQLSLF